jgi:toxin-antitoxin system PIN domain toxin
MAASGVIKLVDANVWLALAFSDHQHHGLAKEWFEAQVENSCAFCRVTQMALLRHLTNAKIMGSFAQSQQGAWKNYDQLANDPRVTFLGEPVDLDKRFREFTQSETPAHAVWTDGWLAAFAVGHGAQVVTFDQGFNRFAGLDFIVIAGGGKA